MKVDRFKEDKKILAMAFRHIICDERRKRDLIQADFGKLCGLSRQIITLFESGKVVPRTETVIKVANGLGISIEDMQAMLSREVGRCARKRSEAKIAADTEYANGGARD